MSPNVLQISQLSNCQMLSILEKLSSFSFLISSFFFNLFILFWFKQLPLSLFALIEIKSSPAFWARANSHQHSTPHMHVHISSLFYRLFCPHRHTARVHKHKLRSHNKKLWNDIYKNQKKKEEKKKGIPTKSVQAVRCQPHLVSIFSLFLFVKTSINSQSKCVCCMNPKLCAFTCIFHTQTNINVRVCFLFVSPLLGIPRGFFIFSSLLLAVKKKNQKLSRCICLSVCHDDEVVLLFRVTTLDWQSDLQTQTHSNAQENVKKINLKWEKWKKKNIQKSEKCHALCKNVNAGNICR